MLRVVQDSNGDQQLATAINIVAQCFPSLTMATLTTNTDYIVSRRHFRELFYSCRGAFASLFRLCEQKLLVILPELPSTVVIDSKRELIVSSPLTTISKITMAVGGSTTIVVKQFADVFVGAPTGERDFYRELAFLSLLQHEYIVRAVSANLPLLAISFPYFEKGTLESLLLSTTNVTWQNRLNWISNVAEALAFVHSLGIIHRDVKSSNILISDSFQVNFYFIYFPFLSF